MRVWGIARGHALPVFEPVATPCHGVTRWVPIRVAGLGGVRRARAGWLWLGAKAVPNAAEGGICLFICGRARRTADRSGATCMYAIQRGQTPRSHPSA